jgi:serine protease Do
VAKAEKMPRDPFSEFFERFGSPFPFPSPQQEGPQVSLGSGILIDKLGHIVTNNHVVDGGEEVLVSLADQKTEIKAKIVGTDPKTDLAVLRLESTKDLPEPAEWADSTKVEVGDWAVAIGSPFALGQSVTVGIVSAKGNRNSLALTGAEYGGDLLQTDAAINPGNSGGPLCDLAGRVMGVNTAIYTRSGGYMGIGFAIPSSLAKDITSKLIKDGKIVRGWLGVYIQPADEELLKRAGIAGGVAVHEVMEESPAATAGIKAGDIITEINLGSTKNPITTVNQLQTVVSSIKPGEKAEIKVFSEDGNNKFQSRFTTVTLGQLPEKDAPVKEAGPQSGGKPDKLGLVVGPSKSKEVVVKGIQPGSVAHRIGLQVGDVLVSLNGKKIESAQTYKKYVETSDFVRLRVRRGKRELYYQFKMGQ